MRQQQSEQCEPQLAPLNQFPFNIDFLTQFRETEQALMPCDGWGTDAEGLVLNEFYKFQATILPTREELEALPTWKSTLRDNTRARREKA